YRLPPHSGGRREYSRKQGATSAQGLHIDGLVIGFAVLPAAIDDAQPFKGQGADRHLVRLVLIVAQVVVVSMGPLRLRDRATRKLVKRLAQKLRADETEMHPLAVATGLRDWGDAAVTLHLVSALVAIPLRAEGHYHAWRQGVAGARQRPKQRPVGVVSHQL